MNYFKSHFPAWICLLFSLNLFSQNITEIKVDEKNMMPISKVAQLVKDAKNSGLVFNEIQALEVSKTQKTNLRSKMNGNVQVFQANAAVLNTLIKESPSQISLMVPKSDREIIKLNLIKVNILSEGFNVFTSSQEKIPFNYIRGEYYRGVVEGNENNSTASISIFENEIIGSFTYDDGNMVIQPTYEADGELILYNDKDIPLEFPFECYSDQLEKVKPAIESRGKSDVGDCVRVYIECDYALFQNKGGTSNTINWITSVFNNIATLYANESINTAISEIFVWSTADTYSKTSSITALNQFKALRPTFNGDLAHLAALGGNNIGGVAWLDVLCSSYKYAYSNISSSYQNVPTYSWTVEVMTHEMGHNLGSNHTQWCGWTGGALDNCYTPEGGCSPGPPPQNGGTIMSYCHLTSYGINFNNGFGPQPGDKIRARVAAASCLNQGCGGGCNTPTGLAISNITQTSATATWNSVSGATSYSFEYKTNSGSTWTAVTTTNPTYNMTGLTSNTLYNTRVKAICASGSSAYSAIVNFTTTGGGCNTPTGLAITNITQTTATAAWTPVSGAISYAFEYKTNSGSTWTVATTTNPTYSMSGLTGNTLYNTRVKANCSSGSSAYSATVNFTTSSGGSCGTPTGLAASGITQTSAIVAWLPVSGANSYNFQYKLSSSGTWQQVNVTTVSVSLSGLSPSTSYDTRVQAVCGSNLSAFTSTLKFTTLAGYCTSKGNNSNYEWVKRVKLGTIDRTSASDGGYYNGTHLNTNVTKGTTYTLNYQAGSSGSSGTLYWRVWIDFNNNSSFNDAGEQVVSVATSSLNLLSANITIPSGAATANVRMRVSMKYGGFASSCQVFTYGEVEDYTLNIGTGSLIGPNISEKQHIDDVNLYPNPFTNNFNLEFFANQDQDVQIIIMDPLGKVISTRPVHAFAGHNTFNIESEEFVPATYLIQIKSSNDNYFRKIIKLE